MIYEIDGVTRSYVGAAGQTTRALDGISFRVDRGERIGVLGASGSGKTSLFRLLNGSALPSGGALRFFGCDTRAMSTAERRRMRTSVGTVFQLAQLVPSLTVRENVLAGRLGHLSSLGALALRIWPPTAEVERVERALAAVDLETKAEARADELSGGQQQRVAIARVLVQEPEVVLADEPFASLDPALVENVTELLFALAERAKGQALVVALHDVRLALRFFPRIVGLRAGRLFFDLPREEVTPALLGELYEGEGSREPHAPASTRSA
jgi:phosphonate transport system ATP-binding protein